MVNRIRITYAEWLGTDTPGQTVKLLWRLEVSPGSTYEGPFFALWFEDGVFCGATSLTAKTKEDGWAGTAAAPVFKKGEHIQIKIGCTEFPKGTERYPAVPLILSGCDSPFAEYDGFTLTVCWNTAPPAPIRLCLSPTPDQAGAKQSFDALLNARKFTVPLDPGDCAQGACWLVSLSPMLCGEDWESFGLKKTLILFPDILKVLTVQPWENGLTVTCQVPAHLSAKTDLLRMQLALLQDGSCSFRSNLLEFETPQGELSSWQVKIPAEFLQRNNIGIAVWLATMNTLCRRVEPENTLSLKTPRICSQVTKEGETLLRFGGAGDEAGFLLALDDEEAVIVHAREKQYHTANILKSRVSAALLYDAQTLKHGPYTEAAGIFNEGYYPDASTPGLLRYGAETEGTRTYSLGCALFGKPLTEPLETGPFKLMQTDEEAFLTLNLSENFTAKALDDLWQLLFSHAVKTGGYYKLRALLARLSPVAGDVQMEYYCGAGKGMLVADLMPGFLLRVETAFYQSPGGAGGTDNAGFVLNGSREYPVSLTTQGSQELLELDSFFNYVSGSWTGTQTMPLPVAGTMDFFTNSVRSGYLRLCCPQAFADSALPGTLFAHNNICLVALTPNQPAPDDPGDGSVPCMLFRGRSSLSIHITIFVNQKPVTVPLGTTLSALLSRCGVLADQVRMQRSTGLADIGYVPVYLTREAEKQIFTDSLILLAGDKLEV